MKSWVVYAGVLVGLLSSCYLYTIKFSVPGREDILIASLAGARKYLPPGSTIKVANFVPPQNTATIDLFPSFISFIVPPARISAKPVESGDTVLILLPSGTDAKTTDSLVNKRAVLWTNKDSLHEYVLLH